MALPLLVDLTGGWVFAAPLPVYGSVDWAYKALPLQLMFLGAGLIVCGHVGIPFYCMSIVAGIPA